MKIKKERVRKVFEGEIMRVERIEDRLEVKEDIKKYVGNSKKKYGKCLEKEEVLGVEIKNIMIMKSLGKVNLVNEEGYYVGLVKNGNIEGGKEEKGEKFGEKRKLGDKIVKYGKVGVGICKGDRRGEEIEVIDRLMYEENVGNGELFRYKGKFGWFGKEFD